MELTHIMQWLDNNKVKVRCWNDTYGWVEDGEKWTCDLEFNNNTLDVEIKQKGKGNTLEECIRDAHRKLSAVVGGGVANGLALAAPVVVSDAYDDTIEAEFTEAK